MRAEGKCATPAAAILSCLLFVVTACPVLADQRGQDRLNWDTLAPLEKPLSGFFFGVHNDALIVAGGNPTPAPPMALDLMRPQDAVFLLERDATSWQEVGRLPGPLMHGCTVSTSDGVLCIGGFDGSECSTAVLLLHWVEGRVEIERLPDMPMPIMNAGAAVLNNIVYVAGGQTGPYATMALKSFWALNLARVAPEWVELEPWPGPGRASPGFVSQNGGLYLFGGVELLSDGVLADRRTLTDSYRYRPGESWRPIADLPQALEAAGTLAYGQTHILATDRARGAVFGYHTITDTWTTFGGLPDQAIGPVAAVLCGDEMIISGPGILSGDTTVFSGTFGERKVGFGRLDYVVIAIYFAVLVLMGFYFAKREKGTDDFFLGGKRVPWWAVAISIFGTSLSAITYLAIPAKAYATDWVFILSTLGIVLIAPFVVFFYLPHFRKQPITTAYEFLERRFNLAARVYGSLIFILYQIGRVSIVLYLPAIALSAATGIDVYLCILVTATLAMVYTILGGIEAVIWTDVLQAIVLVAGAVLALAVIVAHVDGGLTAVLTTGWAVEKFHTFNWTWDMTVASVWVCVIGNLFANAYPYTADQTIVQRYLTTATEQQAARAVWVHALITIPISILFFGLGTALFVFYKSRPELLDPGLQIDAILPLFVVQMFPTGLAGLVIAAVFAAAMSSLDSSLNSVAAVLVTDYYRRFCPDVSDRRALFVARWTTFLFGVIGAGLALLIASLNVRSIFETFLRMLGLVGGGLAGMVALGVFTKRANGAGALIGAVVSTVALFAVQQHTPVHFFLHAAIGFCTCFVVGVATSPLFSAKPHD